MKDKRKLLHAKKVFLNKDGYHSDANIATKIEVCEREQSSYIDAYVSIKDCSYKVTLSIDLYSKGDYNNTIYKLDKLISELSRFRTGCRKARAWYLEAEERVKQRLKIAMDDERKKSNTGGAASTRAAIPRGIRNTPRTRRGTQ